MADEQIAVTTEEMLIEQAIAKANKPARVKSNVLLIALVKFANSGAKTQHHFEAQFPTATTARLNALIKASKALGGKVWTMQTDEFGVSLVNITPKPDSK